MIASLTYLAWTLALAIAQVAAAAVAKRKQDGARWAIGNRDEEPAPYTGVAGRLVRAQANLYETLPLFIGTALLAHVAGRETAMTHLGAALYFWGRAAYVPIYALGLAGWRTAVWTIAAAGLLMMLASVLRP